MNKIPAKDILSTKTVFVFFCLVLVGFAVFTASFVKDFFSENSKIFLSETGRGAIQGEECVFSAEERIVRGNSLAGLIEPEQTVKILFGYYNCHKIEKGDIVAYNYSGNSEPVIKIIKAVEGDKFQLEKSEAGCWNVLINNEILKNSQNAPYCLSEQGYKMLSLYEQDYKGVIPKNTYLILGNLAGGSLDSSRFGLIDKSDILGKVEK